MNFSDFFTFERLITPTVIKVVYWIGLVVIIVGGLINFFWMISIDGLTALLTLVGIVIGLLFWRVFCEGIIVVFNMLARLTEIRDALTGRTR
jgi:hypothetical protein